MIVKILNSNSSFNGVSYNTNKADRNLGELMKVVNFGYLQNISNLKPQEYKNYLLAHSAINLKVKNKQFHVAISCQGKEYDKHQLTKIADDYMKEMGYSNNPYLIVFHKDTNNNHVHVVSSRVGLDGNKISDKFEKIRSMWAIQRIMNNNIQMVTKALLDKASNFNISSLAQYKLIFERAGYHVSSNSEVIIIRKYDHVQATVPIDRVSSQIQQSKTDFARIAQLKRIFRNYQESFDAELKIIYEPSKTGKHKKQIGYSSDLVHFLKKQFGLDIVFHGKENLSPYGYTIIDNAYQSVFKGGQVMPLKEFISNGGLTPKNKKTVIVENIKEKEILAKLLPNENITVVIGAVSRIIKDDLATVLRSCLYDYNSTEEGLYENKLTALTNGKDVLVYDMQNNFVIDARKLLSPDEYKLVADYLDVPQQEFGAERVMAQKSSMFDIDSGSADGVIVDSKESHDNFNLSISDDVDDSLIYRRRRRSSTGRKQ